MKSLIAHSLMVVALGAATGHCAALGQGDAVNGRRLLASKGCVACHRIAGVAPQGSTVGPALGGADKNSYIAGILPNTRENMVRWIMHPRQVHPASAMPELGVSEQEAADMAAYLHRLPKP